MTALGAHAASRTRKETGVFCTEQCQVTWVRVPGGPFLALMQSCGGTHGWALRLNVGP